MTSTPEQTSEPAPRPRARRRGRPPRVTREQIVRAATELLQEQPDEYLTMARVAERVGVSPMALYRHFQDRDELVDEVVGYVLTQRNAAIPRDGAWQDQLRAWILGGLEFLVPCAQVVQVVLAGGTTRWLHDAATLARILELAGFRDDELAELELWIALSVGGYVMAEAARRQGPDLTETYAALAQLPADDAERLVTLIPRIERAYGRMHERFADRIIQSVEAELAGSRPRS
ncbi:MAG TPA: helix-turn-helix domain-containing protein [Acidimicrobiia bacterium]|nr:helix-turn-helix domain-containing protein [Acidimicrobiia bacterium]